MVRYILLLALALVSARGQKWPPCRCSPEQWEALFSAVIPYDTPQGPPGVETLYGNFSFDSIGNRVFISEHLTKQNLNLQALQDFEKKVQYIIYPDNKTCFHEGLPPESFGRCIPDGADYLGRFSYGLNAAFTYDVYSYQSLGSFDAIGFDSENCVPTFASLRKVDSHQTSLFENFGFNNVTTGIKDPSVFDIPSYCNSVEMSNVSKPDIGHIGSQLGLFKKFTKN